MRGVDGYKRMSVKAVASFMFANEKICKHRNMTYRVLSGGHLINSNSEAIKLRIILINRK